MHNVPKLMQGDRIHRARIHPDDAAASGVEDGAPCRIVSPHGSIELPARLTDEVGRGTIAVPHGWGHHPGAGWRQACGAGGANVNLLASSDPTDLERLAGMAHLNGIPVRLEPVERVGDAFRSRAQAAGLRPPA
jgi:formate dehydrogenase